LFAWSPCRPSKETPGGQGWLRRMSSSPGTKSYRLGIFRGAAPATQSCRHSKGRGGVGETHEREVRRDQHVISAAALRAIHGHPLSKKKLGFFRGLPLLDLPKSDQALHLIKKTGGQGWLRRKSCSPGTKSYERGIFRGADPATQSCRHSKGLGGVGETHERSLHD
jgi:hypothetical protein